MTPEEKLEELILAGAVEVAGIDSETGEFLYSFTDKLNEIDPEMARETNEIFNNYIYILWEKGYLNVNMESPSPIVSLTKKALDPESVNLLNQELRIILQNIIEALRIE